MASAWTHDVPTFPRVAGGYRVRRESDRMLVGLAGTVEEAYESPGPHAVGRCPATWSDSSHAFQALYGS